MSWQNYSDKFSVQYFTITFMAFVFVNCILRDKEFAKRQYYDDAQKRRCCGRELF